MELGIIQDVIITPLPIINGEKGDVYKIITSQDVSFSSFGEAYFSTVKFSEVKGWKKHNLMELNIVVPVGHIKFYICDERENSRTCGIQMQVHISSSSLLYRRLTIPPNLWVAFEGIGNATNLLLNVANIIHDPEESISLSLESIPML